MKIFCCKSILLYSIVFFVFFSKAQLKDSTKFYYAGLTSTGTYNQTSSSKYYLFNNGFKFNTKKKSISLNSTTNWLYGKQNNSLTNNDISSYLDLNLYKTFKHFYYWALINYNSTYSLKINNQLLSGVGVAYNIVDQKSLVVNLSDGIIYDYSDIYLTDNSHQIYGTPRNSLRLRFKWNYKDKIIFSGNGFLQNSVQNFQDYIIKSDISLAVKLKKWLSVTSTFTYNQMTRTHTDNLLVTYGVIIENYF